jgi:sugar transferase (PEP-CTERM/EpsH1 system associated)
VDCVTFIDDPADEQYVEVLKGLCARCHVFPLKKSLALFRGGVWLLKGKSLSEGFYRSTACARTVQDLLRTTHYDFVFCCSSPVAQYVRQCSGNLVVDFVDVDSDKWLQYSQRSRFPLRLAYRLESGRLARYERTVARGAALSLFTTEQELALFSRIAPTARTDAVCNGVDLDYFCPTPAQREPTLVFVGAMDYYANVDAVTWFAKSVFPRIRQNNPDATFLIVGRNPAPEVERLAEEPGVRVTGTVPDVRPYLAAASAAVIPLRIARGIQNKVLEAMAMEIPVIIPRSLAKTLRDLPGDAVLSYGDEASLVDLAQRSLRSPEEFRGRCRRLRQCLKKLYHWDGRMALLHEKIGEAVHSLLPGTV